MEVDFKGTEKNYEKIINELEEIITRLLEARQLKQGDNSSSDVFERIDKVIKETSGGDEEDIYI